MFNPFPSLQEGLVNVSKCTYSVFEILSGARYRGGGGAKSWRVVAQPQQGGSVEAVVQRRRQERGRRRRFELARVGVVRGVFEFAVRAQVVRTRVRRTTQRALEPPGEVHVVVVAYVGHHLAAQFTAVEVQSAGYPLERQPHVPALGACNTHTSLPTAILVFINASPGGTCIPHNPVLLYCIHGSPGIAIDDSLIFFWDKRAFFVIRKKSTFIYEIIIVI